MQINKEHKEDRIIVTELKTQLHEVRKEMSKMKRRRTREIIKMENTLELHKKHEWAATGTELMHIEADIRHYEQVKEKGSERFVQSDGVKSTKGWW